MPITLIAVDVDGTLINSEGKITEATKAAVAEADRVGVRIALGTGRARDECREILRQLPQIRYMINCSGASVYDVSRGLELYADGMRMETVRALYQALSPVDCLFEVMADGHIFTDREKLQQLDAYQNHYYLAIIRSSRTPVSMASLLKTRTEPVSKIHLFFRCEADQLWARALTKGCGLTVLNSIPENLEFNEKTASKGVGLQALARCLGISPEDTMAIGDNLNDIEMLQACGHPMVVGNANEGALPYARYRTASCDEDGVAVAIRHVLAGTLEALRKD